MRRPAVHAGPRVTHPTPGPQRVGATHTSPGRSRRHPASQCQHPTGDACVTRPFQANVAAQPLVTRALPDGSGRDLYNDRLSVVYSMVIMS